jgi:uncharacterized protein YegL
MFSDQTSIRRLPIYIVMDTSRSMRGEPIRAVNAGLQMLKETLLKDPYAVETAFVSIIEYNTEPRQVVPLTEVICFNPPPLEAGGWSAMGSALRLLDQRLDQEILVNTDEHKGDYKSQVFLMSDGRPTDAWKMAIKTLRKRHVNTLGTIIALGCGPKADLEILSQVADVVLATTQVTPSIIVSYFKWVSQAINVASKSASAVGGAINLPPPPPAFNIIVRSV